MIEQINRGCLRATGLDFSHTSLYLSVSMHYSRYQWQEVGWSKWTGAKDVDLGPLELLWIRAG